MAVFGMLKEAVREDEEARFPQPVFKLGGTRLRSDMRKRLEAPKICYSFNPPGANAKRRENKAFRAAFTRLQWLSAWRSEVRKKLRAAGLNDFGFPIHGKDKPALAEEF
jgi:hypothetical protein